VTVPSLFSGTGRGWDGSIFCLADKGRDRPILHLVEGINRDGMDDKFKAVSYCLVGPTFQLFFLTHVQPSRRPNPLLTLFFCFIFSSLLSILSPRYLVTTQPHDLGLGLILCSFFAAQRQVFI
jgi:hypothetical protein